MNTRKGEVFRFFCAALLLVIAAPIGLLVSAIIFQGHMHPDAWEYIWQDIPIITTMVVAYLFYTSKLILKNGDEIENS